MVFSFEINNIIIIILQKHVKLIFDRLPFTEVIHGDMNISNIIFDDQVYIHDMYYACTV